MTVQDGCASWTDLPRGPLTRFKAALDAICSRAGITPGEWAEHPDEIPNLDSALELPPPILSMDGSPVSYGGSDGTGASSHDYMTEGRAFAKSYGFNFSRVGLGNSSSSARQTIRTSKRHLTEDEVALGVRDASLVFMVECLEGYDQHFVETFRDAADDEVCEHRALPLVVFVFLGCWLNE